MITEEERSQMIKNRLSQAEKCILDSTFCMENGKNEMAANRIYYGMFYAMLSLGLLRRFETSKHQQMIGWFNKNFVHTDIFPRSFSKLVKKAFESRTNSDYQINQTPTTENLESLLSDMKLFISTIKNWVQTQQI